MVIIVKEFLKRELVGWKKWEVSWFLIATIGIFIVNIVLGEDLLSLIAAVTGIICVVLAGKGKLSAYIFGVIHIVSFALFLFSAKYYGMLMLNIFYYLPMQFYGYYVWQKNMNPITHEVYKKNMTLKQNIILFVSVFVLTILYGMFLNYLNGNMPFVDALSTIISIVALYVSIKMYTEQWLLWIIVNAINIILWIHALVIDVGSVAILIMTLIYFVNSVLMYLKWKNETV